jgi:RND family efflux transporter MFP subunit
VHRGDLIVELDDTVARADLASKQANRDMLKAALDLLQADPRPEDRKGLEIAVEQAKATVGRAQVAVDRLRPLRARKEVSEAQLFEAEQLLVQAQLQHQSAEAQLQLLLVGPRPEAVEEATARLAAAEEAVTLSQAHLDLLSIRSPIDGVLDSLTCHPGQTIAAGTPIGEVVDTSQLNVVVWLPPPAAAKISAGQLARVTTSETASSEAASSEATSPESKSPSQSEPDDSPTDQRDSEEEAGTEHVEHAADHAESSDGVGRVTSVGRVVDPQTGNLPVRILLDNAHGRVAVGQTVSVSIITDAHAAQLVIPSTALIDLGEGPLVVVVREGKAVHLHPSATATHGTWTIILGTDLEAGEPIVIEGGFNLPEETAVLVETDSPPPTAEARR